MARQQKLKVFRTAAGFHDAYVAAPSQKAALAAWGSDADLFARGIAELVTDEALTREPLENPGKVIKRLRGTPEEQVAALPADRQKSKRADGDRQPAKPRPTPRRKPNPRPSRAKLDEAEQALDTLMARQKKQEADLRARERALEQERRDMQTSHDRERKKAEKAIEQEHRSHSTQLARWRAGST